MNIKKYIDIKFLTIYPIFGSLFGIISLIFPIMSYLFLVVFDNNWAIIQGFLKILYRIKTNPIIQQDLMYIMPIIIFFGSFLPMLIIGVILSCIKQYFNYKNHKVIIFLISAIVPFLYSSWFFINVIISTLNNDESFSIKMTIIWALSWVLYSAIQGFISTILAKFILPKS